MKIQTSIRVEKGVYIASSPELDITARGNSLKDALQNFKEAVEGFFKDATPDEIKRRYKKRPPKRDSDQDHN
jgi:predicted RNase H-like HicB family nuclease